MRWRHSVSPGSPVADNLSVGLTGKTWLWHISCHFMIPHHRPYDRVAVNEGCVGNVQYLKKCSGIYI